MVIYEKRGVNPLTIALVGLRKQVLHKS